MNEPMSFMQLAVIAMKIILLVTFIKAVTIGSDYSFVLRWKYGKMYDDWYKHRQTFEEWYKSPESTGDMLAMLKERLKR